jgi:hypothetical protein
VCQQEYHDICDQNSIITDSIYFEVYRLSINTAVSVRSTTQCGPQIGYLSRLDCCHAEHSTCVHLHSSRSAAMHANVILTATVASAGCHMLEILLQHEKSSVILRACGITGSTFSGPTYAEGASFCRWHHSQLSARSSAPPCGKRQAVAARAATAS